MSATDELRRMLDERGAKYREYGGVTKGAMEPYTNFVMYGDDGCARATIEANSGDEVLLTLRCSAEQAIAATVERGTCHDVSESPFRFECSECGGLSREIAPRFCPCCGRRVVE